MPDAQRISMIRIKFIGNAKYFWNTILCDVDLRRHPPLLS